MGTESLIRGRRGRSWKLAALTAVALAACSAWAAPARGWPADAPPTAVEMELNLGAGGHREDARFQLEVTMKTSAHPELRRVWANGYATDVGRRGLIEIIEADGLLPEMLAEELAEQVSPSRRRWLPQNVVRLRTLGDATRMTLEVAGPGLWASNDTDCPLHLRPSTAFGAWRVPATTAVTIRLVTAPDAVQVARPQPARVDGEGIVEWRYQAGAYIPRTCAALEAAPFVNEPGQPPEGFWEHALQVLKTLAFALPAVPLLGFLGIWWVLRRRPAPAVFVHALDPARRLVTAGLLTGLAFAVAETARRLVFELDTLDFDTLRAIGDGIAGVIAVAALMLAAARLRPVPPAELGQHVGLLIAAAVLMALLPVSAAASSPDALVAWKPFAEPVVRAVLLALAVAAVALVVAVVVRALWSVLLATLPTRWSRAASCWLSPRRTARRRFAAWGRRHRAVLLVLAVVTILVGLGFWQSWWIYGTFETLDSEGPLEGEDFPWIAARPGEFALTLLQPVTFLIAALLAVAVLAMLAGNAESAPAPRTVLLSRPVARLIAVLFATAVVLSGSTAGELLPTSSSPDDAAPRAPSLVRTVVIPSSGFALGVATVLVLWRSRRRTAAARQKARADHGRTARKAVGRERAERRLGELYAKFTSGELPTDDYLDAQADTMRAIEEAEGRDSAAHVPGAFALGPTDRWRANLRTALAASPWFAALPLLYVAYVIVSQRVPAVFDIPNPYGPIFLLQDMLGEALFWIVAAAALGLLYPYLPGPNGAVKGLALAALFVLPHAIIAVILPGYEDTGVWFFVGAELGLFLMGLGVWLDYSGLRHRRLYWRHLIDLYRLRSVRGVLAYAVPVALLLFSVAQQVGSGEAGGAVTELLKGLGTLP